MSKTTKGRLLKGENMNLVAKAFSEIIFYDLSTENFAKQEGQMVAHKIEWL